MARSPLFQLLQRLTRDADYLNQHPEISLDQLLETRRRFLKQSLIAGATVLPLASLLESCATTPNRKEVPRKVMPVTGRMVKPVDMPVIILGGGIAGLTAAYHLTKAGIHCEIYESSNRLGGRMNTIRNFNSDGMVCELGGEFVDSNHADIIQLCKDFNIKLSDFSKPDKNVESEMYYFGGQYFVDEDLIPRFAPFARRLREDKQHINYVYEGGHRAYADSAKKFDHMSLKQYLETFKDTDPWILKLIEVAWVGEMGRDADEQPALFMISGMSPDTNQGFKIFGESDQSMRIHGGNASLITALAKFLEKRRVKIHLGQPIDFIRNEACRVRLSFSSKSQSAKTIYADRVICTLPFSVLRNVYGISLLDILPLKKQCIMELGYGGNSKLMMSFQNRIWRKNLRREETPIPRSNGMVYTDLPVQNLWDTSLGQVGKSGILTSFLGGKYAAEIAGNYLGTSLENVDEIFPSSRGAYAKKSTYFNWNKYQHNLGSYASPTLGQASIFGDIARQTELGGRLLFAGEHAVDHFGGFMNGACRSGRMAAEQVIAEWKTFRKPCVQPETVASL